MSDKATIVELIERQRAADALVHSTQRAAEAARDRFKAAIEEYDRAKAALDEALARKKEEGAAAAREFERLN